MRQFRNFVDYLSNSGQEGGILKHGYLSPNVLGRAIAPPPTRPQWF
ncbi:MAG TPA: hypothetical protein IGS37_10675 [Synechococcales cyanobacterium M55_K2018_004]|nr:hypothetical protein [Synechococcales cyanobacterium M55_K2018_004]